VQSAVAEDGLQEISSFVVSHHHTVILMKIGGRKLGGRRVGCAVS